MGQCEHVRPQVVMVEPQVVMVEPQVVMVKPQVVMVDLFACNPKIPTFT